MQLINNRTYQVTNNELENIGHAIDVLKSKIKHLEYGVYDASHLVDEKKVALRVLAGMGEWQTEHNKGIRLKGDTNIRLEVYDIKTTENELNKTILEIDW